ncbi:MAG: YihY/virulence factor BrkB family protein [Paramuribaculum sp.]|nr:YihY/virulence factor BrkB family protein [Paramuribaculum sp.]
MLINRCIGIWNYCTSGVWNDSRKTWQVNLLKTINLSVSSFLSHDLQSRACALTYRTLLALVPALALLLAIGRGFGLQQILQDQLIKYFPSQHTVLNAAFGFVDSYLKEASGGVFVGIGIVFLLWTLISLLSSVEDCFNNIWQIVRGRLFWRKVTDYLAIFLILPVIMICASGLQLFMTTSLKTLLPYDFIDSALPVLLDCLSIVLTWLFFAGSYMLIPNTKVKPIPAIIAGVAVGSAYQILQWLFVSGQMYVAKYNAIYGSFSFLPLLLLWLQLVWLFTLIGGVLCYASQNISEYNFSEKINRISTNYRLQIAIVIMGIISKRFYEEKQPVSASEISQTYAIPINLVRPLVAKLNAAKLVNYLQSDDNDLTNHPLQPALEITDLTVGEVADRLFNTGESGFIEEFNSRFPEVSAIASKYLNIMKTSSDTPIIRLMETEIPSSQPTGNQTTLTSKS